MSLNQFRDNDCLLTAQKHCPCIEFVLSGNERHGFHASQLLHYRLGSSDHTAKDAAPEKLTLAFATADVTLIGYRLDRIAASLRDGELLAVRTAPSRYASLENSKPVVVDVTIHPIEKG